MDKKAFDKARQLNNDIYNVEKDIKDIDTILAFDKDPQVTIEIKVGGWQRSFGGKKYNMIKQVKLGLISLRSDLEQELVKLQEDFDKL